MMLIDPVAAILALLAGALLGLFYFVGLWLTVCKLGTSRHVALIFVFSLLFRATMVMVGFHFILGDNWLRLLVSLLGFMVVRLLATGHIRQKQQAHELKQQVDYAP